MIRKVLVVDDDAAVREALSQSLELAGLIPVVAGSFVAAKDHINEDLDGVILSDIRMPGRDGFYLLDYAKAQDADLPVVLLTGQGDIPMAVDAMGKGAFAFLEKPCAPSDLLAVLDRALKARAMVLENRRLRAMVERGDPAARLIFGHSAQVDALRARVRLVAQQEGEALVAGAAGTGTSKVAEVIHLCSVRSKAPFVKVAGAGLTVEALEGALQSAAGGSLFIDQITLLPAQTQLCLLEALDKGGKTRLIAGSNRDLQAATDNGDLSAELFYRLEVLPVRIPSLSERPEDIPVLFRHYVAQASEQAGLTPPEITPDVIAGLMVRDWPGNARALMSEAMRFAMGIEQSAVEIGPMGLAEQMAQVEQSLLEQALRRAGGQASHAAKALKLPRKTFYDKLARYGIKPETFR
jgi:two-component system C4-dicarboxylate transport response regulator DctD